MRPGVNVLTRESPPVPSLPLDVTTGFMVGITEKGPLVPLPVHNLTEYESIYGTRQTYATAAYDSADGFFDEGGKTLYVGRVVGPAAAVATVVVNATGPTATLNAFAKGPGDYGNDLNVVIRTNAEDSNIPVGYFRARIQTDAAVILEESYDLFDDQSAILWSTTVSKYVTFVDNAASANDPIAGTYALAGGLLDQASIVDAQWATGFTRFTADMGSGLVFAPGRTSDVGHGQIKTHEEATGRLGLYDGADTATSATLTASVSAQRSRFAALFAPWLRIGPVPGGPSGSSRLVPPSGLVAGLIARNVGLGYSANEPAAGNRGIFRSVLGVSQSYDDTTRQTLNTGGVNVIRDMFGQRKLYGYRTTADPSTDSKWLNLGNSLIVRDIQSKASQVGERFMFRQIDGQGKLLTEFQAALTGEILLPMYQAGALYGATPDEAFAVDVSDAVNTAATIANNELHAVITVRTSPYAEEVDIEIVKLLITEAIPA